MPDLNPYAAPTLEPDDASDASALATSDAEGLPVVYGVRKIWIAYWLAMIPVGIFVLTWQLWYSPCPVGPFWFLTLAFVLIYLGVATWCLNGRIEISPEGIRTHKWSRNIPLSDIKTWEFRTSKIIVLRLRNGQSRSIFGPATSRKRNNEIAKLLGRLLVKPNALDFVSPDR